AKEIRITRRVHIAQFTDRLLLRDQTAGLDISERLPDQRLGRRAEHDRAQRVIDPVFPHKSLRAVAPGVAGVGRAKMYPGQSIPWRRRALLEKQLHAAVTDLMAGRG